MKKKELSTSKSFVILTIITFLEKMLSFVLQAMVAAVLGATVITDSYFTSAEFMTLVDATLFNGLVVAILNQYTFKHKQEGSESASKLLSDTNLWFVMCAITVSLTVFCGARPLSYVLAPGFDSVGKKILVRDIRIISFVPIFVAMSTGFLVILRQRKDFFVVGLKSLFISLSGIGLLFFIHCFDLSHKLSLAWSQLIAIVLYLFAAYIGSRKYDSFSFWCMPKWGNDQKRILKMWLPLVISNGISRVSLMVDRIISSNLGEGSVSCLTYSQTLYNFVHAIIVLNLCMILLSDFTNLAAENRVEDLKDRMTDTLTIIIYVLVVITVLIFFYSTDIVSIVFERGNFDALSAQQTGGLLLFYGICLVPSAINNIYIQLHYAFGKTTKTMLISLFSIIINIVISVILSRIIGLNGIAIGTLVSTVIMAVLYMISTRKLIPEYKGLIKPGFIVKCGLIISICAVNSVVLCRLITYKLISFVLATCLSFLVSFIVLIFMKDKEVLAVIEMVKRRIKL